MWFFLGLSIAGVLIALWAYTPGSWPFKESLNRRPGETRSAWQARVDEEMSR